MKTGLSKKQKVTELYFNENDFPHNVMENNNYLDSVDRMQL